MGKKLITQVEFEKIYDLRVKYNLPVKKVAEITKRAESSITQLCKLGSLEAYNKYNQDRFEKAKQKKAIVPGIKTIPTSSSEVTFTSTLPNNILAQKLDQLENHLKIQDKRFEEFAELYSWVANNATIDIKRKGWFK